MCTDWKLHEVRRGSNGNRRSFEEAFQKAIRMANEHYEGFSPFAFTRPVIEEVFQNYLFAIIYKVMILCKDLECPTDKRMLALARALYSQEIKN